MKMNGIEDFMTPQCMDIAQPNHGFFGYLLRCKCLSQEDVSGDFIFIDDGTDCFVRFPSVKSHREKIRTEWNARTTRYHDFFQGLLFYVNEDRIEDFADFMTDSPDEEIRQFLQRFMTEVRAAVQTNIPGIEPLYAVSHIGQLANDGGMQWPHIHILWGIKK